VNKLDKISVKKYRKYGSTLEVIAWADGYITLTLDNDKYQHSVFVFSKQKVEKLLKQIIESRPSK
jgi:hypothetical protein